MSNRQLKWKNIPLYAFVIAILLTLPGYTQTVEQNVVIPTGVVLNGTEYQQDVLYAYENPNSTPLNSRTFTYKTVVNGEPQEIPWNVVTEDARAYFDISKHPYTFNMHPVSQRVNQVPTKLLNPHNKPIIRQETTTLYTTYPHYNRTVTTTTILPQNQTDQNYFGNELFIRNSETLNLFPPVGPEDTKVPVVKPGQPTKKVNTQIEVRPIQSM